MILREHNRFTDRCVIAICSLAGRFVRWPATEEEKRKVKVYFEIKHNFRSVIGSVAGTTILVYRGPSWQGGRATAREHCFSMGATAVCNHRGFFTYFHTGYYATTLNTATYRRSALCKSKATFFSGEDYLLADASYAVTSTVIPRYKGVSAESEDAKIFNKRHEDARIKIEHAIGMLKGKFRCLNSIRINSDCKDNLHQAGLMALACVILHNITRLSGLYDSEDVQLHREQKARQPLPCSSIHIMPHIKVEPVEPAQIEDEPETESERMERELGKAKRDMIKVDVLTMWVFLFITDLTEEK